MSYYSSTPPTLSGYSVNFSNQFDERDHIGVPCGFQAIFRNAKYQYCPDDNAFSYDVVRGNTRTAEYVSRDAIPGMALDIQQAEDSKYTNFTRVFPLAKTQKFLSANEMLQRNAGEKLSEMTRRERLREKLTGIYKDQTKRIIRLDEIAAATVIQTGKMAYKVGSSTLIIDFKRASGNTFAATATWDGGSGVPQTDIKAAVLQAESVGNLAPNCLLLDAYSAEALFKETSIQALADVRGFRFIEAGSLPVPANLAHLVVQGGFLYRGMLMLPSCPELAVFVCRETYTNTSGSITPMMTAKTAVLFNSDAEYRIYVGPTGTNPLTPAKQAMLEDLVGISAELEGIPADKNWLVRPGMIEHDLYEPVDGSGYVARSQSAVVFAPVMTDSIVTLTGCAA